jgi:hypothetical protein
MEDSVQIAVAITGIPEDPPPLLSATRPGVIDLSRA